MTTPLRKVLVVLARPLFQPDPLANFADALAARLNAIEGVVSEVMAIPVRRGDQERLLDDAALCGWLRTLNVDRVVALNFPAYMLPFGDTVVWLADGAHPFAREAELADDEPAERRGKDIRCMIRAADIEALSRSGRLFCASAPLREAMRRWCGATAEILADPGDDERRWARAIATLLA